MTMGTAQARPRVTARGLRAAAALLRVSVGSKPDLPTTFPQYSPDELRAEMEAVADYLEGKRALLELIG